MMEGVLSGGTGSVVVTDGPALYIPGPEVDVNRKPCRVTATLLAVYYGGDNIGSEWRYEISVNTAVWLSGQRILHWRTWDHVGKLIYEEVLEGGCGSTILVTIGVRARERNWHIFDDIGDGFYITMWPCLEEPSARRVVILVPVPEYLGRLCRCLFRKHRKVALLHFVFGVEAQCVAKE